MQLVKCGSVNHLQLLTLPQLDYKYVVRVSVLLGVGISVARRDRHHLWFAGVEVGRGDEPRLLVAAPHVEGKLHRAVGAEVGAGALSVGGVGVKKYGITLD